MAGHYNWEASLSRLYMFWSGLQYEAILSAYYPE